MRELVSVEEQGRQVKGRIETKVNKRSFTRHKKSNVLFKISEGQYQHLKELEIFELKWNVCVLEVKMDSTQVEIAK